MAQLIDKAALVVEIEKLKNEAEIYPSDFDCGRLSLCEELMNFLDTLEIKEVNLEEEIARVSKNEYFDFTDWKSIARHFFELGLQTKEK